MELLVRAERMGDQIVLKVTGEIDAPNGDSGSYQLLIQAAGSRIDTVLAAFQNTLVHSTVMHVRAAVRDGAPTAWKRATVGDMFETFLRRLGKYRQVVAGRVEYIVDD